MFDISKKILSPSEYKIIKFLALNGPLNRWEIHKGTKINYQTVHSAVERLLQKRVFINVFNVDKAWTDLDKPSYSATFVGKLAVMAALENDDELNLIATSEPRQFFILEEWEYICRNNLARDYVLSIIRTRFLDLLQVYDFENPLDLFYHSKELEYAHTLIKNVIRTSVTAFYFILVRSILWDGYPHGGVPRLIDYGDKHDSDIFKFFMDNPQIKEQMKIVLLLLENESNNINSTIWQIRRRTGNKEFSRDFIMSFSGETYLR